MISQIFLSLNSISQTSHLSIVWADLTWVASLSGRENVSSHVVCSCPWLPVSVHGCLCLSMAVSNKCHIFCMFSWDKLSMRIRIVREPGLHGLHDSGPLHCTCKNIWWYMREFIMPTSPLSPCVAPIFWTFIRKKENIIFPWQNCVPSLLQYLTLISIPRTFLHSI